jgi:carboxypeptidase C (cathepsin A)
VDNADAGWARTYGNLTFVQVKNAGHMVPLDQPSNALDMTNRFLNDQPFV